MKYLAYHYVNFGERQERMGVNQELNALQKEVTRQRILEAGFRLFAEKGIEKVTMTDVAEAAGLGVATVYRYYSTKPALALGISAWSWEQYLAPTLRQAEGRRVTAAAEFRYFLDVFLDLYRNHKDLLRFNVFFNIYVENDRVPQEAMSPFGAVVERVAEQFHRLWEKGERDHTLREGVSEKEMFFSSLHLMLAAVTRYAVGLVFDGGLDPERELLLLKNMLLREYTRME